MSFISGTIGAIKGAEEQRRATNANLQMAREANEANYRLFQESRGSTGSAFLPLYADPGTEKALLGRALTNYRAILGDKTPEQQMADYQQLLASMQPAIEGGNQAIRNIYSGELERQQLAQAQPVFDARLGLSDQQRQAIALSLQQNLAQQAAEEAAKGYVGGGSFARGRALQATLAANEQAAANQGAAKLQNALDTQSIQRGVTALQLQSLDTPINRATQLIQNAQAPATAVNAQFSNALRPLEFFRLSPQAFKNDPLPQVSATPGAFQLAMQGISQGSGALLNAYLNSNGTLFGGKGWGQQSATGAGLGAADMGGATNYGASGLAGDGVP